MTDEITIRQTTEEATGAVPAGQRPTTGGARLGAERKFNHYLYENLVSNLECQINAWIRKAAQEPEIAQALRLKAEGLSYALRLLFTFKPEFQELVEKAGAPTCQGCGAGLEYSGYRQATDSSLCDSCYEIGRDEEIFIAENAADFDGQCWL
ncbi:MAG TPA: hypothetical protein VFZ08_14220 [Terriglobia bacterium]|nr:hypothetical protein [Terriglobia bacterium]